MEKKVCWSCNGSGVVQASQGRGYSGVCQTCDGDGHIYELAEKQVSKDEYYAVVYEDDED